MLTKNPFYHGITKKMTVAFGGLFNNIHIRTRDLSDKTTKIVKVPIAFAQKEKFIVRLQQDPDTLPDKLILLPRLSFEIVGLEYDRERQRNKINRKTAYTADGTLVKAYNPAPYILTFNLYSYTKTIEDNLQIMEQILPFFTPDMNLSIKILQDPETKLDVPLVLNGVTTDDDYGGSFEDRRYIISTYSFSMKVDYYGPLYGLEDILDDGNHFEDANNTQHVIKRVIVDINNTTQYRAEIDPFDANSNDVYTINESWTDI